MDEFLSTLGAVGVGGLISGLAQCNDADRDLAITYASQIVPKTVFQQPDKLWRLAVQRCVISLVQARDVHRILMLGNDLSFLEALQENDYNGKIELLLSHRIAPADCLKVAKNAPTGLDLETLTPGLVPALHAETMVVVIGFDAGSGYVMVESDAACALGSAQGQGFTGDVIAILPLGDTTVHDRSLENWKMVSRSAFTDYCLPDGLEPVPNNV